ncbi:MAG: glycosyl transferase family 1 [Ilumatobacteraceae bacterium]|nr:glycosyl transferase family 1 [Ilumatobacteraceae bacterium]
MPRVLMTADAVGGVWTYCLELADALAQHHVDILLAVLGPSPTASQRDQVAASSIQHYVDLGGALEWMDDPWTDVAQTGSALLDLASRFDADVVHLNNYSHAVLPWRVPTVVVAHSDVVSWWHAVIGSPPPVSWTTYEHRVRAGLEAATAVIAPTAAVLADLHRNYGTTGGSVIHNGRRDDWVHHVPKEQIVFGVGRMWDEAKNVTALEHIAQELEWPVVIAGEVAPRAAEPDTMPARLLGALSFEAVATWLGRASVFASPAKYEPFGLAALEAALSGCALVLGDIPSLREVWDDAALYVDPDEPAQLAGALRPLLADPGMCRHRGERALARAQRYQAQSMGDAYASLYRSLLVTHRGG